MIGSESDDGALGRVAHIEWAVRVNELPLATGFPRVDSHNDILLQPQVQDNH